ncbi:MAG: insulinase family protein [Spirochaetaceae bacterium]|jgi:zinc protease|nr:insulinase family protein [Spirochaetaceae bacterium]
MYKGKSKYLKLIMALCITSLTLFCMTCATGAAVYNGLNQTDTVPVMENLKYGKLPGGLRYYIYENRKPENRAYLTLAVNAGAVLEDDDENGLAHFIEHMAFNGTGRFPGSEVVDYLRSLGMRFGADINAYTTADETVYGIEVPVETDSDGIKRIPVRALDIIEDWTSAITFAPEAVDDERRVIMEEYRMRRLGPEGRQQKILWTELLAGSRYAKRDIIGLTEIIENAPAEKLKSFYKKWYKPENMALIFSGDFDGQALEESLALHFDIPAGEDTFVHPEYSLPPPVKNSIKVEISTDPELQYAQAVFFYKQEYKKNENNIAEYREALIDGLIDKMFSERFEDALLNPQSPLAAASADFISIVRPSRFYALSLVSKPGMMYQALDNILALKESVNRYGFTNTEIERAKQALLSDTAMLAAEKEKNESYFFVRKLTSHYLYNISIPDIDWELEAAERLLRGISKNDIHKAVKKCFLYNDIFVFISAPEAEAGNIPSKDAIMQKIKSSGRLKIKKPDEAVFDSALLDSTPVCGSIDEETVDENTGIVEWKLRNGARVLLKSTTNKNDEIELYAVSRGGAAAVPLEDVVSANAATELLSISGTGPWSRGELTKKLSGKQISFSFNTNDFTRNIQGWSNTADIKTLFELLYLTFTDPRIDSEVVPVVIDEYRTLLARRSQNPEAVFFDEIKKITYNNNPRFMPLTMDDIPKIDAGKALDFIKKCLNPADYTFVITGNIDRETLSSLVETYIASIPAAESFNQWTAPSPPLTRPGKTDSVLRQGKEDKGYVYSGRFIAKTFDENTAMVCNTLSEYLDIVLVESIREKLGGAYTISAMTSLSPVPPDGELCFEVIFICDPKRAVELNAAVEAELAKIASGSINADTFDKARKALIKNWEQSMQNNSYLSKTLANYAVIFNIQAESLFQRPATYEALRQVDIQNLMKQILQSSHVTVMMYPAE